MVSLLHCCRSELKQNIINLSRKAWWSTAANLMAAKKQRDEGKTQTERSWGQIESPAKIMSL